MHDLERWRHVGKPLARYSLPLPERSVPSKSTEMVTAAMIDAAKMNPMGMNSKTRDVTGYIAITSTTVRSHV
jgi:hypothetical protein